MKKEFTPLLLFISGITVFSLLSALGIIYSFFKMIYESFQLKFWKGIVFFIVYWLKVLYEIWNVFKYYLLHFAISLDLFGNVCGGNLIEDCVTDEENTLYGKGNITISAATGDLELRAKLNKTGTWLTWLLTKVLGFRHSINAYILYIK